MSNYTRYRLLLIIVCFASLLFLYYVYFTGEKVPLDVRERFFQNEYLDPQLDPSLRPIGNVRAALVVLTRNEDLTEILRTMKQFESRWNRRYNYPYIFLNDAEFNQRFKDRTSAATRAKTFYGWCNKNLMSLIIELTANELCT